MPRRRKDPFELSCFLSRFCDSNSIKKLSRNTRSCSRLSQQSTLAKVESEATILRLQSNRLLKAWVLASLSKERREVRLKNGMRNKDMRIVRSLMDGFFLISVIP